MYIIVIYDIAEKRCVKVSKLLKKYINFTQNSCYEGDITEYKYKELVLKINKCIDVKYDSVKIFSINNTSWLNNKYLGIIKNDLSNII